MADTSTTAVMTLIEKRNANIPPDLKELPQWTNICRKDGKKQPGYINGNEMKWGTRSNWYPFSKVSPLPDIEFILSPESGIAGIDFDGCVSDGVIHPLVQDWLVRAGTYGEISESGKGLKLFLRASLPGHKKFRNVNVPWKNLDDTHAGIEVHTWQPFAITGNRVDGCPSAIRESPEVLNEILARFAPPPKTKEKASTADKRNGWDFDNWVRQEIEIVEHLPDGYLIRCPWASEHSTPGDVARIYTGPPHTFHCFHSHCADRVWRDVRLHFDPHAYDAPVHRNLDKLMAEIARKQEAEEDATDDNAGLLSLQTKIYDAIEKEDTISLLNLAEGIAMLPEIEQAKLITIIRGGMAKCKEFSIANLNKVIAQAKKMHKAEIRAERMQTSGGEAEYEKADTGMLYYTEGGDSVWISNFTAEIKADVTTDDGAEQTRSYELEAEIFHKRTRFDVPAKEFSKCEWVDEKIGARGRITTGQSMKSHLINAVKYCSDPVRQFQYAHTGWREVDGKFVYLHSGGALSQASQVTSFSKEDLTNSSFFSESALQANLHSSKKRDSQDSQVSQEHIQVKLTGTLTNYVFPLERSGMVEAIKASLEVMNVADDTITAPLYCGMWRAPIGDVDFGIHLAGQSGWGKTALVALIQQHFGALMTAHKLPGSWESTENSLEMLLFQAKDTLVVVDDFKPKGGNTEQARLHAKADRMFRQLGNGSARGRLTSNLEQRVERRPRCLMVSTGEDVPRGQSLKARGIVLTMNENITVGEAARKLSVAQTNAQSGLYAQAMAGYIEWLAPRIEAIQTQFPDLLVAERSRLTIDGHSRTSTNVAHMLLGMKCFLQYACENGAITAQEATAYLARCKNALMQVASESGRENREDRPSEQWKRLVVASITNKSAHITTSDGKNPGIEYGWIESVREVSNAGGYTEEEITYRGGGSQIGWIDGDDIFLLPAAAYKAAKAIGSATGDDITTLEPTLRKFLFQDGVIASTDLDKARKTITVRHSLQKLQRDVLHVKKKYFFPESPLVISPDLTDLPDLEPSKSAPQADLEHSHVPDLNDNKSSQVLDYVPSSNGNTPHKPQTMPTPETVNVYPGGVIEYYRAAGKPLQEQDALCLQTPAHNKLVLRLPYWQPDRQEWRLMCSECHPMLFGTKGKYRNEAERKGE